MPLTDALGFAAIAFTLIAVPGPDWAYVLAAGARDHTVLAAVTGIATGYALVTLVVVAGLGPLVADLPAALTALTVAGACYLAYLGTRALRSAGASVPRREASPLASSSLGYLTRGMGVSALNPKGLLIFLSVLPQFTRSGGGWPLPVQIAALGGIFILIAANFYLVLGYAADRVLSSHPNLTQVTTKLAGTAMICLAVALVVQRIIGTTS